MLRLFFAVLILSFSLASNAQEEKRKFDFGISFEPSIGHRFSKPKFIPFGENESLHPIFTYSTGLSIGYWFSPKMKLEGGIAVGSWGNSFSSDFNLDFLPLEWTVERFQFYTLQIPLNVEYYWLSKDKFSMGTDLGVTQNFVLKGTTKSKNFFSGDIITEAKTPYRSNKHELSVEAGIPLLLHLSKNGNLRLTPNVELMVTDFSEVSSFKLYFYKIGLDVTYLFGLGKKVVE